MNLSATIRHIADSAIEAVFPAVCEVCGTPLVDGEKMMCLLCETAIPRTRIHSDPFNEIHRRIASPGLPVERAGAYFYYYRENEYARLIHKAKYNSRPSIARELGRRYAREIADDGFFNDIDVLIPVPLHFWKKARRGYNQSAEICKGISEATGVPIDDTVLSAHHHSTQTRRGAVERLKNVEGMVRVRRPEELHGKHLLVVDDVITTGATMLSTLRAIHTAAPTARLSVLSLALTKI